MDNEAFVLDPMQAEKDYEEEYGPFEYILEEDEDEDEDANENEDTFCSMCGLDLDDHKKGPNETWICPTRLKSRKKKKKKKRKKPRRFWNISMFPTTKSGKYYCADCNKGFEKRDCVHCYKRLWLWCYNCKGYRYSLHNCKKTVVGVTGSTQTQKTVRVIGSTQTQKIVRATGSTQTRKIVRVTEYAQTLLMGIDKDTQTPPPPTKVEQEPQKLEEEESGKFVPENKLGKHKRVIDGDDPNPHEIKRRKLQGCLDNINYAFSNFNMVRESMDNYISDLKDHTIKGTFDTENVAETIGKIEKLMSVDIPEIEKKLEETNEGIMNYTNEKLCYACREYNEQWYNAPCSCSEKHNINICTNCGVKIVNYYGGYFCPYEEKQYTFI